MAYYATLNAESVVTSVFPGKDNGQDGIANWEAEYSKITGKTCKLTSYNGTIRKNFASVGFRYDSPLDAFIAPKPQPDNFWQLDTGTCRWVNTPEGAQYYIGQAVNQHLDMVVSERQYNGIDSMPKYLTSTNARYAAEAAAAVAWCTAVWEKVEQIQQQVLSGQRPIPSPSEVIAELPVIQWPPA